MQLFFNAIIKEMWDVFAKKNYARVSSAYDRFSQFSFESNTATSDKHKGVGGVGEWGSAVIAIIIQFYFYFAHLKST